MVLERRLCELLKAVDGDSEIALEFISTHKDTNRSTLVVTKNSNYTINSPTYRSLLENKTT